MEKTTAQEPPDKGPTLCCRALSCSPGWVQPRPGKLSLCKKGSESSTALWQGLRTRISGSCGCSACHRCSSVMKHKSRRLSLCCLAAAFTPTPTTGPSLAHQKAGTKRAASCATECAAITMTTFHVGLLMSQIPQSIPEDSCRGSLDFGTYCLRKTRKAALVHQRSNTTQVL